MAPAPQTSQKNKSVPESAGHRRASRNTPAFTIVAECKYADTGVGAAIACGSQKWNGNCALFVSTPSRISSSVAGYQRMRAHRIAGREHDVQVEAADDAAEHEHAEQQRETAADRHDRRHARAAPRVGAVVPVRDQHERREARELPEHDELDQVARRAPCRAWRP